MLTLKVRNANFMPFSCSLFFLHPSNHGDLLKNVLKCSLFSSTLSLYYYYYYSFFLYTKKKSKHKEQLIDNQRQREHKVSTKRILADCIVLFCQVIQKFERDTTLEFTTVSAIIFIHCWRYVLYFQTFNSLFSPPVINTFWGDINSIASTVPLCSLVN